MKRAILKGLKVTSISTSLLLLALFLLPFLFPGAVTTKVKAWANNSIKGDLNFSKARLSFFNHFPSLTLTLYEVSLKGAAPFSSDTLIAAKEVALGVNLATLFSNSVGIDEIYLTEGDVHVLVDSAGHPNYNVYESSPSTSGEPADSGSASLKIARIQLEHCNVIYDDRSLPMYIRAMDLNYTGKGDLSKAQFDLFSDIKIGAFDLSYGGTSYISSKKLNGNLVTKINTNSLDFIFERNDIKINELPVAFKGAFGFLKNGYRMDFSLQAKQSALSLIHI